MLVFVFGLMLRGWRGVLWRLWLMRLRRARLLLCVSCFLFFIYLFCFIIIVLLSIIYFVHSSSIWNSNSNTVLVISKNYKDSPNTRLEAEYAFQQRKELVPVMVQPTYRPDGWLGALTGEYLCLCGVCLEFLVFISFGVDFCVVWC